MNRRQWVLFAYCLWTALVQFEWLRFAPIMDDAARHYGVGVAAIDLLALVYPLLSIVLAFPVGNLLNRISVRSALRLTSGLVVAGCGLRLIAPQFSGVMAAQILLGIGQPVGLALIARLTAVWFDEKDRLAATSLGTMSIFAGIASALLIVPATADWLPQSLRVDAALVAPLALLTWFCVPRDPVGSGLGVSLSWRASAMELGRAPAVPGLLLLMFFGNGFFNSLFTVLEPLLMPRGISARQAGLIGLAILLGGVSGMAALGKIRLPRRWLPRLLAIAALCSIPVTEVLLRASSFPVLCLAAVVLGVLCLALLPVLIEVASEVVREELASTAVGVLWLAGNAGSVVFMAALSSLGLENRTSLEWLLLPLMPCQAIVAAFFLPMRRLADHGEDPLARQMSARSRHRTPAS